MPIRVNFTRYAITVDTNGDIFVTGHSWPGVGWPDYATVDLDVTCAASSGLTRD